MTSKTLRLSNNSQVHYLEHGQGEVLVLIHGVGMQAAAWYPQIEYFSKNYRVISVDMPGHGESDALLEGASLQDFVQWAIHVIEHLSSEPVNLAGHSMGSLIATGVAATRPDLVKRVAVLNGVYKRTEQARQAVIDRAEQLKDGELDIETPLQRWFGTSEIERLACDRVKKWLQQINLRGYATAYSAFARGDNVYADLWEQVQCPALILTGEDDLNSTAAMSIEMAKHAPLGVAVIIDQHRHMVNLTAPEQVNQAMEDWLKTPVLNISQKIREYSHE
ncbi:alpha/beta hydrolase [Acinetobacter qingfengensis]|uniref:Alpha/beta hydrolase n=1 Tax=Acinetobacter qingfengensis TaxID=1262585 RepID=A0A1E7RDE8_9GAMM|nr:alpha/beta hydrolase [Acinetobacter qingfengensis]KAA8735368.1 alpha/beta hydrolase [Acinetobacter qingfengensis]OEY97306.1 alpha/beta hydrolase [Acinetobacter qingfengensis]